MNRLLAGILARTHTKRTTLASLRIFTPRHTSTMTANGVPLQKVIEQLEQFAPLAAAEKWDNVGLLIEPHKQRPIGKILLTNDLTERVMHEALQLKTDMIISYHPPIFAPLKRITQSNWKERIVAACLSESIALYSPHTAWDATSGGVNDWLASALQPTSTQVIQPHAVLGTAYGAGRCFTLNKAISLRVAIAAVQEHIGLDVHVAFGVQHTLETVVQNVAVCAGSGASVLKDVIADLYITGEMSHHDVLDANHRNATVLLCNHSNSERGYLKQFAQKLHTTLPQCEVIVSQTDADPLSTFVRSPK